MNISSKHWLAVSIAANIVLSFLLWSKTAVPPPVEAPRRAMPGSATGATSLTAAAGAKHDPGVTPHATSIPGTHHIMVPERYLDHCPNYLVDPTGQIDTFYADLLGLSKEDTATLNTALQEFRARGREMEKKNSRLEKTPEGDSFLVVDQFGPQFEQEWKMLTDKVAALAGADTGPLINRLLRSSPFIASGHNRLEISFTEVNNLPVLRVNKSSPGSQIASSDEDLFLDGSDAQKADLSSKYGHLLDTDTSLTELAGKIAETRAEIEARTALIRSYFEKRTEP